MKKLLALFVIAGLAVSYTMACSSCGCSSKKSETSECEKSCSASKAEKSCCGKCSEKEGTCDKEKAACSGKHESENGDHVHALTAPNFTLNAYYQAKNGDGQYELQKKEVTLKDLKGKYVVLEWANYDCPFVKPHYKVGRMEKLAAKYADDNVVWLTINSTHYAKSQDHKEFLKQNKLKHQHLLADADGKVGKLYGATNTPQMFVIDKDGSIAYQGAIDNAPRNRLPQGQEYVNYVDNALAELTEGKEVSVPKTKPYGCTVKYAKK